jgi:hypothetical protein
MRSSRSSRRSTIWRSIIELAACRELRELVHRQRSPGPFRITALIYGEHGMLPALHDVLGKRGVWVN